MNALLVGDQANISVSAVCLVSFSLMKVILALNGWDAEMDFEILLRTAMTET